MVRPITLLLQIEKQTNLAVKTITERKNNRLFLGQSTFRVKYTGFFVLEYQSHGSSRNIFTANWETNESRGKAIIETNRSSILGESNFRVKFTVLFPPRVTIPGSVHLKLIPDESLEIEAAVTRKFTMWHNCVDRAPQRNSGTRVSHDCSCRKREYLYIRIRGVDRGEIPRTDPRIWKTLRSTVVCPRPKRRKSVVRVPTFSLEKKWKESCNEHWTWRLFVQEVHIAVS